MARIAPKAPEKETVPISLIPKRLTVAQALSIAALLALAATAFAAGHGGKRRAAEQAPKAATTAAQAGGAHATGGLGMTTVFVKIPRSSTATVGTFAAFEIVATCNPGGGFEQFEIRPLASGTELRVTGEGDAGPVVAAGRAEGAVSLNEAGPIRNAHGISTFSAARPGAPAVVGTLGYDDSVSSDGEIVCAVYGKVAS